MPYLSDARRDLLAPAAGPHPREGQTVPNTSAAPFLNAACWAWALNGEYLDENNPFTANTIYTSDAGAFVFDALRRPTGLNHAFFQTCAEIFPASVEYYNALTADFDRALGGDGMAQTRCRVALVKFTAVMNEHTVLPDDGSNVYTLVMNTNSWYGWDHWGIGIKGASSSVITYQQKVTNTSLRYNCGVMWDEHQPLVTTINLDGLLQTHIDVLNF